MKSNTRLILVSIAFLGLLFIVSCKQNNSASVVGNWALTNVTGSSVSDSGSVTVTYNSTLKTLTEVTVKHDSTSTSTVPYTLLLKIMTGGIYVLKETYTIDTSAQVTKTDSFTWLQGANALTLGSLDYNGVAMAHADNYLFNSLVGTNSSTVSTITGSQMVLTFNDTLNRSGIGTVNNYTLSFSN